MYQLLRWHIDLDSIATIFKSENLIELRFKQGGHCLVTREFRSGDGWVTYTQATFDEEYLKLLKAYNERIRTNRTTN